MGLSSAERKRERGIEHVKTLCAEAKAFEGRDAYVFESERNPRSAEEIEYRCFAIEREPPADHWPLLAGEAIQNLRSALDHIVYAASKHSRGQFPIFTDACEFQVLGGRMLKGVPEPMRARIEKAQPYIDWPEAAAQHPLAVLSSLSNLDKHRVLATVASAVQREMVGVNEGIDIRWEKYATNRPLGAGKTHISTFVAISESEIEEMDVQPDFAYQVCIEGRPLNLLIGIAKEVFLVTAELEAGEPLSPFAAWPI